MERKEKPYENYDHLDAVYGNTSSMTECTGLIAHAPLTEDELLSYMDIYDFGPPIVRTDNIESGTDLAFGSVRTTDEI